MPNIGDIIRASDFSGAGFEAGAVVPFYKVTLSGRYPIFWGKSEADTSWLVCDGGDDLHGGNVPDLRNKFIMGVVSVDEANITGGSTTTSSTTIGGNVGSTTLTTSTMPSHTHSVYVPSDSIYDPSHSTLWDTGDNPASTIKSGTIVNTGGSGSHTHSLSSTSHTHTFTPPYYSLIYLVKLPISKQQKDYSL